MIYDREGALQTNQLSAIAFVTALDGDDEITTMAPTATLVVTRQPLVAELEVSLAGCGEQPARDFDCPPAATRLDVLMGPSLRV